MSGRILDWIFPKRCAFCGEILSGGEAVCASCRRDAVPVGQEICTVCGRDWEVCMGHWDALHFDACVAVFYYDTSVKKAIKQLKYEGSPQNVKILGELMAECIERRYRGKSFDGILFVPMHPEKKKRRGFNQTELLAKTISKVLYLPVYKHILYKAVSHSPQHTLSGKERFANIAGTFEAGNTEKIKGKSLLLVDDVETTGATLSECAETLKNAGADSVNCAVFAVTGR